jgi:ATP-dependent Clp protease adaptor protein ClpS
MIGFVPARDCLRLQGIVDYDRVLGIEVQPRALESYPTMNDETESQTAVMEPIVTTRVAPREEAKPDTTTKKLPPYNVVILNDEEHTFDYVIELLAKLFGHSLPVAVELTFRIDQTGRAVVYTTHKEKAELKRDQVLAYGPDPRMSISKTSLGCYIEPAPTG